VYKVILQSGAEASFKKLTVPIQKRIAQRMDWLAENAGKMIHHPLTFLPDDLRGLCRLRVGDYRILYWVYFETKHIKIYGIEHRSKDYRSIKK